MPARQDLERRRAELIARELELRAELEALHAELAGVARQLNPPRVATVAEALELVPPVRWGELYTLSR
jgi:hypothetical protein